METAQTRFEKLKVVVDLKLNASISMCQYKADHWGKEQVNKNVLRAPSKKKKKKIRIQLFNNNRSPCRFCRLHTRTKISKMKKNFQSS